MRQLRYILPVLIFFMAMFLLVICNTYLVFAGAAQFAFGFYSVMLTSTALGMITMIVYKPRSWCIYCPMGTATQGICQMKHRKDN